MTCAGKWKICTSSYLVCSARHPCRRCSSTTPYIYVVNIQTVVRDKESGRTEKISQEENEFAPDEEVTCS